MCSPSLYFYLHTRAPRELMLRWYVLFLDEKHQASQHLFALFRLKHTHTAAQRRKAAAFFRHRMRERERECVGCCAQRRGSCSSQSLLYVADKWSSLVTNRVPHANLARPRCCREKIQCWCFGELKMQPTYMVLTKDWVPRLKIKEELEAMRKLQSLISLHDATKLVKIYVLKYQATGIIAKIQTNEPSMGKSTVENIYWFLSSFSVIILLNLTCA